MDPPHIALYSIDIHFNASTTDTFENIVGKEEQQTAFENIVGKGDIAHNERFLLFQHCFPLSQKIVSSFVNIFDIITLLLLNWKNLKLAYQVKG